MPFIAFIMLLCGVLFPVTGKAQIPWTMQTLPRDGSLAKPFYGAGKFFASPTGSWGNLQPTATSTNGITWTITKQPRNFRCIASSGLNHFVGIDMDGYFYSSKDGAAWTRVEAPRAGFVFGLDFSGGRYVGVCAGAVAGSYRYFYSSPDFNSWTFKDLVLPSGYNFFAGFALYGPPIAFGNDVFAVQGYKALVDPENLYDPKTSVFTTDLSQSSNGTQTWTLRIDSAGRVGNAGWSALRYLNNQFILVGWTGVYTSANGMSWKKSASSEGVQLSDVAYGNSTFVAVGPVGSVYTSKDNGVTWIKNTTNVWSNLTGVCFGGGKFICTGPFEGVLKSP